VPACMPLHATCIKPITLAAHVTWLSSVWRSFQQELSGRMSPPAASCYVPRRSLQHVIAGQQHNNIDHPVCRPQQLLFT
jgi:hypothetical protein